MVEKHTEKDGGPLRNKVSAHKITARKITARKITARKIISQRIHLTISYSQIASVIMIKLAFWSVKPGAEKGW